MRSETISIHGGYVCDAATRAVAAPIYQNVAYEFASADEAAGMFDLEIPGYRYSRISNPTVDILEKRVALLEGGKACLATASGQAALSTALLNVADRGGSIVAPPQLYGTSHTLIAHTLRRHGVTARFAKSDNPQELAALIDETTRAVFCETVGNPAGNICDIEAIAKAAHEAGVPLIVDNTVATPILMRPIDFGADIVVHSLTKFMGGHGVAMGGAIVDSGRFDWRAAAKRFPAFSEPDESYHGLVYLDRFGAEAYIARARSVYQRTTGAVLAPMNAFLILQGVETLALRMERHVANARRVAFALRDDPRIDWVEYAGFEDHRYRALADKYLGGRPPSLLTFGVRGGLEAAKRFYDALKLVKRVVNIGDVRTLCCHPASTTHRQMTPLEQRSAGVLPETIRLSVGLEHAEDILEDLDQALGLAVGAATKLAAE
jgi:O-acetylhomoserine (thiol)-lyase